MNLLDNALKYTPSGGTVDVSVGVDDVGDAYFEVADSGPGIPEDEHTNVLDRFVRLEGSRSTVGSGLGLSLVSAVAKLHQARLVLKGNEPGLAVRMAFPRLLSA